ncbi:MAG: hypothetical protein JWN29_2979 [Acidimicrobiales bacterium]|jgi:PST family polysaccharide transporter|nr:hypothetical protein [Acidimicrobiales bacterium]
MTTNTPAGERPLSAIAARGVLWQGLAMVLGRVLVFGATVLLARILVPEEFGLVALALVFIGYFEVIADLGVAEAVVFLPPSKRTNDAAAAFALAFSGGLCALAMVFAPQVASFFGQPEVAPLFRVLSLTLVLGALAEVPDALLRKNLDFRRRVAVTLTRSIGRGVVSVVLAATGSGAWAIALGNVIGDIGYVIVAWLVVTHRPSWSSRTMRWRELRPLVTYGSSAAAGVVLSKLIFDIDYLIVGRRLGAEALGFYMLAFRVPEMAIITVFFVFSSVSFPVLTRVNGDPARMKRGYLTSVRLQATYGVVIGVGIAVAAPALVGGVFGDRWHASIVPLQALALYAAFRSLGVGAVDVYKAMGRPGMAVWLSIVRFVVLVPALLAATRWGIQGVAVTQAVVALVFAVAMQGLAARVLGLSVAELATAVGPAIAAGLAIAATGVVVAAVGPSNDLVRLTLHVALGGCAALLALRISAPTLLASLRTLLLRRAPVPA